MPQEKIALLGFGDIARRMVTRLGGSDIVGVKRSAIDGCSVPIMLADCADQAQMDALMQTDFDVLVMTFTPSQISDAGYKAAYVDTVHTLLNALNKKEHQPRLLLFVSSTSVYGQHDASWVDESSPTLPASFSGKRLLEAERLLKDSPYHHCCVRFSGIYGSGRRRLIDQVMAGKGSPETPVLYSNRIHVEDCAGVLAHLIEQQKHQDIADLYLASDSQPTPLYEVKHWIAKQLGFDHTHLVVDDQQPQRMLRSSKRCANKKLLASGYQFQYPSYQQGYGELLKELT